MNSAARPLWGGLRPWDSRSRAPRCSLAVILAGPYRIRAPARAGGKGPSKRHEIFYLTETTLAVVRIDDFKYRFTDLVAFGNFMLATAAARVVGKAVLVTNAMPFLRHYDRAPLIQPILFKTVVYWAVVFVARLLEHFVRFWLIEHNPSSIICSVTASFGASSSPTGGPSCN